MPVVYRIRCAVCAGPGRENINGGFAGATILDGLSSGVLAQSSCRAVLALDGRLIPMLHPIESSALREANLTGLGASIRGRVLEIENVVCIDCGQLGDRRSPTFYAIGYWAAIVLVGLVGIAMESFLEASRAISPRLGTLLLWGGGAFLVTAMSAPLFLPPILRGVKGGGAGTHSCSTCGSERTHRFDEVRGRELPCPHCRNRTLTIDVAGKS